MESEAHPVFKVSRVLWFPMSVNAVAIGALCFVLFWAWTLLLVAIFDVASFDVAARTVGGFDDKLLGMLMRGDRPSDWTFWLQVAGAYALWAIGGVAMARIMAVRIARDEYITIREAVGFAWSTRNTALLYAPAVLLSVVFLWAALFAIGLVGQIPWVGWMLSAVLLPVSVFFVILVRVLLWAGVLSLGMTAGAIACEKKGTWDSVAKAFNYLFARPMAFLMYVVLLGVFVVIVRDVLLDPTHLRTHVSRLLSPLWTPPADYRDIAAGAHEGLSGGAGAAAWVHRAIYWVIEALIAGAILSWIVGAFTAMFLIFRKEVDGTDYGDIVKGESAAAAPAPPTPAPPSA